MKKILLKCIKGGVITVKDVWPVSVIALAIVFVKAQSLDPQLYLVAVVRAAVLMFVATVFVQFTAIAIYLWLVSKDKTNNIVVKTLASVIPIEMLE